MTLQPDNGGLIMGQMTTWNARKNGFFEQDMAISAVLILTKQYNTKRKSMTLQPDNGGLIMGQMTTQNTRKNGIFEKDVAISGIQILANWRINSWVST